MAAVTGATSAPRPSFAAARALAFVRIVVGLWFSKTVATKLTLVLVGGILPLPAATPRWIGFLPKRLAEYAASTPVAPYHDFLVSVAIPHSTVFAFLTAFGEATVGIGLVLGLLTPAAATVGLFLVLNYGIASFGQGPNQQGFHLVLAACMIAFLAGRAGQLWSLDAWLRSRRARPEKATPTTADRARVVA